MRTEFAIMAIDMLDKLIITIRLSIEAEFPS
jgi:hypothetical protein